MALTPSDWYIRATEGKDRQNITIGLSRGMPAGDAMIEMDIDLDQDDQDTARCRVWLTRPKALGTDATFEAGDLERYLAWCWLEMRKDG